MKREATFVGDQSKRWKMTIIEFKQSIERNGSPVDKKNLAIISQLLHLYKAGSIIKVLFGKEG